MEEYQQDRSSEFFELAKAVSELNGPGKGKRHTEVLKRGKYWVMYKVVRDVSVEVGYINWYDYGYHAFVKINLEKGCVIYYYYPIAEIYKLSGHDIAGLMGIKNVGDLLRFIEMHARDNSGRTPCRLPITEW
jgi:hypothetical protein